MFFLVNNSITWQSMKQRVVAQSSCESDISGECNVSGIMACSSASRCVGTFVEHAITEGGQQVRNCANTESGTPRIE
jgi:hypothetical protein